MTHERSKKPAADFSKVTVVVTNDAISIRDARGFEFGKHFDLRTVMTELESFYGITEFAVVNETKRG